MAEAALADGLEHPLLFNVAALNLEMQGRVDEAEQLLQRAVAIAPRDVGSRNALGLCLLRLDRPDEALAQFDAIIDLDSSLPFVHASRGNSLFALGAMNDAEAELPARARTGSQSRRRARRTGADRHQSWCAP